MEFGIVTVPVAPVRKKPDHRRQMVNQLFFGESVKILKRRGGTWLKIESLYDGYEGWLTHHLITAVDKDAAIVPGTILSGSLVNEISINGSKMYIPMGSMLRDIPGFDYTVSEQAVNTGEIQNRTETLLSNAMKWLNVPYLWGGKTIMGVDCSGFCQTMYKLIGQPIHRDAWQQAQQGNTVKKLEQVLPGDLAFFDDKDEVVHVGILLGPDTIIHASGKVRIDTIDRRGIINSETGKRTHYLKTIKRFL